MSKRSRLRIMMFLQYAIWGTLYYAKILSENSSGKTDYINRPAEDFARSLIEYRNKNGDKLIVETTTSWCV